jgi:hypothetical protein
VFNRHIRTLSKIGIVAGTLGFAAPMWDVVKPYSVYHNGADILFAPEAAGSRRLASFGPWNLGERLGDDNQPLDGRLNLYVVVPGSQYRSARPEYDHNRVVNKYMVDGKVRDWDIFWCFVLDPSLRDDLRSERELLMAKHETFRPADLFDIRDTPAHALMAERLGIKKMNDLKRFRRKDGSLPRLLILPARLAVRATAALQAMGPPRPPQ